MDTTGSNGGSDNEQTKYHRVDEACGELKLAPIDHEEYDALADLFLGSGEYAPEPFVVAIDDIGQSPTRPIVDQGQAGEDDGEPREPDEPAAPNHDTHTPILQLARHEDDAELGVLAQSDEVGFGGLDDDDDDDDESFELGGAGLQALETLEATGARASALLAELMGEREPVVVDAFAHAGDDDATESPTENATENEIAEDRSDGVIPIPCIEVVVLGHLPVRASLWARQYACSRARDGGETVALIRAASGSTSVDLISSGEPIRTRSYGQLQGALQAVSDFADRVILRVDEGGEPELLERPEVQEITILTGADEAAVVASYRLVKTLDAMLGERSGDEQDDESADGPMVRLAVMGAGNEQASDACMKLENAVETFIERPVEIVVGSGRIDATGTTNLYRDSLAHQPGRVLDGLVAAARRALYEEQRAISELKTSGLEDGSPEEFSGGQAVHAELGMSESVLEMKPIDAPPRNTRTESSKINDGLCALIPGLSSIEARCPKAAGVEIGVDQEGRLHLVVCDDDTEDAMNRLLAAQTWARNNLGLLMRAEPDLMLPSSDRNEAGEATMHLISAEPREMSNIYDTQVRVYALARVRIGQVIAQVATPIN